MQCHYVTTDASCGRVTEEPIDNTKEVTEKMRTSLQTKIIALFVVLGTLAVATGTVLLLGYAMAAVALGAFVVLRLKPVLRRAQVAWEGRRVAPVSRIGRAAPEEVATRRAA